MPTQLARKIMKVCVAGRVTVAVAESCTGGLIAHRLTNIPGSSQYVRGGIVAYSDGVKTSVLGVPTQRIRRHGAVSRSVVMAMARQVRRRFAVTMGIAVSGIAGPSGGTPLKPVGTIWIGLATSKHTRAFRYRFRGPRGAIKRRAATAALRHLLHAAVHRD